MNKYTLPSKLASVEKIGGGFEGDMPVTGLKRNDALMEAMGELYKAQELIADLQAENAKLKKERDALSAYQDIAEGLLHDENYQYYIEACNAYDDRSKDQSE